MINIAAHGTAVFLIPKSSIPQVGSMAIQMTEKPSGLPVIMKNVNKATSSAINSAEATVIPTCFPLYTIRKFKRHSSVNAAVAHVSAPLSVIIFNTVITKETNPNTENTPRYCARVLLFSFVITEVILSLIRTDLIFVPPLGFFLIIYDFIFFLQEDVTDCNIDFENRRHKTRGERRSPRVAVVLFLRCSKPSSPASTRTALW